LHGWGDSGATFKGLADNLKEHYTLLIPDLPGFGASQMPPSSWGTADYASFIASWLKKINAPKPHAFVAHSFGGAIVVTGLGRGIISSERLVLLASSGIRNRQRKKHGLLRVASKPGKAALYLLPKKKREQARRRLYKSIGSDRLLLPQMDEIFSRIINEDIEQDAKHISIPTLLVYGTEDKGSPPEYGQILNQVIAGSKLELVRDGGHFLHQENPGQLTNLIKDFLNEKSS
ncbi:MAG TPA: alpha/beta hydrolase, partial [Candidatus Saccharimonadales bacterium]|nr:alpha/beta hydrolase [Candidatus Saccharimonadales bacterium]